MNINLRLISTFMILLILYKKLFVNVLIKKEFICHCLVKKVLIASMTSLLNLYYIAYNLKGKKIFDDLMIDFRLLSLLPRKYDRGMKVKEENRRDSIKGESL